jgi:hypothetical protein
MVGVLKPICYLSELGFVGFDDYRMLEMRAWYQKI